MTRHLWTWGEGEYCWGEDDEQPEEAAAAAGAGDEEEDDPEFDPFAAAGARRESVMGTDDLITVTAAAAILQTTRTTVQTLIAEDRLTAYRLQPNSRQRGKKVYLARLAVEQLAASDWRKRRP